MLWLRCVFCEKQQMFSRLSTAEVNRKHAQWADEIHKSLPGHRQRAVKNTPFAAQSTCFVISTWSEGGKHSICPREDPHYATWVWGQVDLDPPWKAFVTRPVSCWSSVSTVTWLKYSACQHSLYSFNFHKNNFPHEKAFNFLITRTSAPFGVPLKRGCMSIKIMPA